MKNYLYVGAIALTIFGLSKVTADNDNQKAPVFATDNYSTQSDQQLLQAIRTQLGANQKYSNVTLSVESGVVTVRGYVDTQADSTALLATIKNVNGVQSVMSYLQVKNKLRGKDTFKTESDRLMVASIRSNLHSYFSSTYDNVTINVSNGVVTLAGWVMSPKEAQEAVNKAKAVEGVKSVVNTIRVQNN